MNNELQEIEDKQNEDITKLYNFKNKNERLSWKRKFDKLQDIIDTKVKPLEEEILTSMEKKNIILEEVEELRKQMVNECVHPKDFLIHKIFYVECKFCNAKLSLPK